MIFSKELFQEIVIVPKNQENQPPFELHEEPFLSTGSYNSKVIKYKFGYKGYYPNGFEQHINVHEFENLCLNWAIKNGLLEYKIMAYSENKNFVSIDYVFKNKKIENYGIYRKDIFQSLLNICQLMIDKEIN